MAVGAYLTVLSGIMGAAGAKRQAQDQAWALEDEALTQERNAVAYRTAGKYNAEKQQMDSEQVFGSMRTNAAASGVKLTSGNVIDVLRQSHVNAELDRQNILYGAEIQANRALSRAWAARQGAQSALSAGNMNAFTSLFRAGAAASQMSGGGAKNVQDLGVEDSSSMLDDAQVQGQVRSGGTISSGVW